ncbi:dihydropteroate synthase-like protein [Methanocella conradii]|uniref:dihydropteroate synthase-like protein n=1 Tax=Methanocella conradii TaxID=1175444 RepID=UPI0024B36A59|nr:dihydropteroate synthase-like protein [Methanocella conradii]MDI6897222.1 dihydropteroate synthase-like protein [Methanocella conradii]
MRILLVTGRLAYPVVKEVAEDKADVLMLDVGIAAFTTPKMLEKALADKKGYDLILVSGLVASDFSGLEEKLGVKVRLGPRHAYDIPLALAMADRVEFSHEVPADLLLEKAKKESALKELEKMEGEASFSFMLKGVKIGGTSSMKVLAEVVEATRLSDIELIKKIESYGDADIIDLGIPLESSEDEVRRVVRVARSVTRKPVSVDTLIPDYIRAGIDEGASLVLNLNGTNMDEVGPLVAEKGVAAVVIPDGDSLGELLENVEKARSMGIKNIIACPILQPVGYGFMDALERHREFRRRMPEIPMFFGAGNVTELMDADSIGINALLAGMAMELGASVLFTTEASHKTVNSVHELKAACMMMALAKQRKSSPKDLGLDLLVIKEKRARRDIVEPSGIVEARRRQLRLDPAGSFSIFVKDGKIYARNGDTTVVGDDPAAIIDTLVDRGLVSTLEHAGYLGRELEKARLAIRFKRSYLQDDEF